MANDPKKSLTQLEDADWGLPAYDSHLVRTIHQLRDKPIGDFSVEELRITIGQNVGLLHLLPIAIERLNREPLAEGDFYGGDLLQSVLATDPSYWSDRPDQREQVRHIAERALRQLEASGDSTMIERGALLKAFAQFGLSE